MSKLRLSGATSGYEEIKTADAGDNNTYQVGSTVTDAQGNVRALDVTTIIAEQRTNLRTYSTVPDSNNNYRVQATSASSSETAPDGSTDAVLLTATGTAHNNAWDNYNNTYGANLNDTMTYSFFIKAEDATSVTLKIGTDTQKITYDFTTDSISYTGSAATAHVEHYGNGWVRVGCTAIKTNQFHYWLVELGGTTKTAHVWGVQLEVGSPPSSYIPTAASTVSATSVTIASGSSGKYFKLTGPATTTININAGNFAAGDIITIHNATSSDMTIDFDANFTDTVYIAGDGTDKNNSTITLAGYGLATCIAFTSAGMIVSGNVS